MKKNLHEITSSVVSLFIQHVELDIRSREYFYYS